MQIISRDQFADIAKNATIRIANGTAVTNSERAVCLKWKRNIDYVAFAKAVQHAMGEEQKILLFHEYGIWPSSENEYLFKLVMRSLLKIESGYPGQYFSFSPDDRDAAQTILQLGLQSGWGGLSFCSDDNWFYFDHEGFGIITSALGAQELVRSFPELVEIVPR